MAGRPEKTEEEKKEMLRKLEPYLKSGLSLRKALCEAQIPSSTLYDIMGRDEQFSEQITRFQQFLSIMTNNAIVTRLQSIVKKQQNEKTITKEDEAFLKWYALNSKVAKEEYGERKEHDLTFDPREEMKKIDERIKETWPEKEDIIKS